MSNSIKKIIILYCIRYYFTIDLIQYFFWTLILHFLKIFKIFSPFNNQFLFYFFYFHSVNLSKKCFLNINQITLYHHYYLFFSIKIFRLFSIFIIFINYMVSIFGNITVKNIDMELNLNNTNIILIVI